MQHVSTIATTSHDRDASPAVPAAVVPVVAVAIISVAIIASQIIGPSAGGVLG